MAIMTTFFIEPMNEGQSLNYSEIYMGTRAGAENRARNMKRSLQRILKQGTITVEVEEADAV